jgi:hypothetical protein
VNFEFFAGLYVQHAPRRRRVAALRVAPEDGNVTDRHTNPTDIIAYQDADEAVKSHNKLIFHRLREPTYLGSMKAHRRIKTRTEECAHARVIQKEVGSLIIHTVAGDEPGSSVASRFDPMCEEVAACRRPQVALQRSPAGVVAGAVVHRRSPTIVHVPLSGSSTRRQPLEDPPSSV